jgi:hypothetical protein
MTGRSTIAGAQRVQIGVARKRTAHSADARANMCRSDHCVLLRTLLLGNDVAALENQTNGASPVTAVHFCAAS